MARPRLDSTGGCPAQRRHVAQFIPVLRETTIGSPESVRRSTNVPGFSYDRFASPIGAGLQFTASTNLQALPYEIEQWNPAGESLFWVQVPLITGPDDYITAYWHSSVDKPGGAQHQRHRL